MVSTALVAILATLLSNDVALHGSVYRCVTPGLRRYSRSTQKPSIGTEQYTHVPCYSIWVLGESLGAVILVATFLECIIAYQHPLQPYTHLALRLGENIFFGLH